MTQAGEVCASAGILGQALAYSGTRRGIPITVVAARTANPFKIERVRALGATVLLEGADIEDARVHARTVVLFHHGPARKDVDLDHITGRLHARRERQRRLELIFASGHQYIGEIEPGGADGDAHLARLQRR